MSHGVTHQVLDHSFAGAPSFTTEAVRSKVSSHFASLLNRGNCLQSAGRIRVAVVYNKARGSQPVLITSIPIDY